MKEIKVGMPITWLVVVRYGPWDDDVCIGKTCANPNEAYEACDEFESYGMLAWVDMSQ